MGHNVDDESKERGQEVGKKEGPFEMSENSNVIGILKRLQQQITFLERKVDHLTSMLENKPDRESRHFKSFGKGSRPYYGQSERKDSRSYYRDDDKRPRAYHQEKDSSSGKSFGTRVWDKKKVFSAKKSTDKYQGKKVRRDA